MSRSDDTPIHPVAIDASRRALFTAAAATALLAACGGDGSSPIGGPPPAPPPPAPPSIQSFEAERPGYFVGEQARVRGVFTGGSGRIDAIGPVESGQWAQTPVLADTLTLRLTVASTTHPAVSQTLTLRPTFRDRYGTLAAPLAASGHSATPIDDGTVLLIGGSRGNGVLAETITRYDPRNNTLTNIGGLAFGRSGHTATRLDNGRILVTGGSMSLMAPRTTEIVDEISGRVTRSGDLATARVDHTATRLNDGRVLVVGGAVSGTQVADTLEIWTPDTGRFRTVTARMAMPRAGHSATLLADGRVLIVGGYTSVALARYRLAEIFDPQTETLAPVAAANNDPRWSHAAHRLDDGSVLVLGGARPDPADAEREIALATAMRFIPATAFLDHAPALASARRDAATVRLPNDRVALFGGLDANDQRLATAEIYTNGVGGAAIARMPGPRSGHTATRLNNGRVFIAGGDAEGLAFATTPLFYE